MSQPVPSLISRTAPQVPTRSLIEGAPSIFCPAPAAMVSASSLPATSLTMISAPAFPRADGSVIVTGSCRLTLTSSPGYAVSLPVTARRIPSGSASAPPRSAEQLLQSPSPAVHPLVCGRWISTKRRRDLAGRATQGGTYEHIP